VQSEADERSARDVCVDDRVAVGLLAEVQVRREDVLEEVDEQVSAEDEERSGLPTASRDSGMSSMTETPSRFPAPSAMRRPSVRSLIRRGTATTAPPTMSPAAAARPSRRTRGSTPRTILRMRIVVKSARTA